MQLLGCLGVGKGSIGGRGIPGGMGLTVKRVCLPGQEPRRAWAARGTSRGGFSCPGAKEALVKPARPFCAATSTEGRAAPGVAGSTSLGSQSAVPRGGCTQGACASGSSLVQVPQGGARREPGEET